MSGTGGGFFPELQLSEFISSLENCEWALTRTREALKSMTAALKELQQQYDQPEAAVKEETRIPSFSVAKIELGNVIGLTSPARPGVNNDIKPISERIESLLERERYKNKEKGASAIQLLPQPTSKVLLQPVAQSTQNNPSAVKRPRQKPRRTEKELATRRERRKRAKERKRAVRNESLSEAEEVQRVPLQDMSRFGTAANKAPLPFNRLEMHRPNRQPLSMVPETAPQNCSVWPGNTRLGFTSNLTSLHDNKAQDGIALTDVTQENGLALPTGNKFTFGSPFQQNWCPAQQNFYFSSAITSLPFPAPNKQNVFFNGPRIETVVESESEEGEVL